MIGVLPASTTHLLSFVSGVDVDRIHHGPEVIRQKRKEQ